MVDMSRKIAAQARPWIQTLGFDAFQQQLPDVMKSIADIGFGGFETALGALPLSTPGEFADWRQDAGDIELVAAHTSGRWWEPNAPEFIAELMGQVESLPSLGCDRLMTSIDAEAEHIDDAALRTLCANLELLGSEANQRGVHVSIHNHAHELRNDARILRAIVDGTDASHVNLGADIGWVGYAGWNPVDFIQQFGNRLDYLHVRDVVRSRSGPGFIEVGRGEYDWREILSALDSAGYAGWFTIESEFSEQWLGEAEPATTLKKQWQGVQSVLV